MENYTKIIFTDEDYNFIKDLSDRIIEEKKKEEIHKKDGKCEPKRWTTGLFGELAVEKYFNINIIDETVGNSKNYAHADLKKAGYNVGVKTCCFPNFPVINRDIHEPQLFVLLNEKKTQAMILGLADLDLLQENLKDKSNDELIFMKSMLDKKTAFSKIEKLKKINSIDELETYRIK